MPIGIADNALTRYTDRELIVELARRRRVKVLDTHIKFFNELEHDEAYMRYMDESMVQKLGAAVHNKMFVEFSDEPVGRDHLGRVSSTLRLAKLTVVVPEDVGEEDGV